MKGAPMTRSLFLALPALALLAACGTQDNATTRSETATVPGDDGTVAAPADTMDSGAPGSGSSATTDTTMPTTAPDANAGPENTQDNAMRAPGPANPPTDDAVPPPAK